MRYLAILYVMILIASCKKNEEEACTVIFIQHNVKVIDSNGDPVVLDTFYTQNNETKQYIHIAKLAADSAHIYPIINDNQVSQLSRDKNTNYTFSAIKGTDTVKAQYVFKNKECHPYLVSGSSTLLFKP